MRDITILYKSGVKVHFQAKSLTVTRRANGALELQWDGMKPRPLLIGVDEIAAIWEGKP